MTKPLGLQIRIVNKAADALSRFSHVMSLHSIPEVDPGSDQFICHDLQKQ